MSVSRRPDSQEGLHVVQEGLHVAPFSGIEPTHPQPTHHSQPYSTAKQEPYADVFQKNARTKLCGIPTLIFWPLVALVVALVAGIAIVGGVLGSRHTSSPALAPTGTVSTRPTTVTTTASAVSATGGFSCTQNGTAFTSSTGSIFKTLCQQDLGVGVGKDASGNVIYNNTVVDLESVIVDSYGVCIDACAVSITEGIITWDNGAGKCAAVAWVSEGSGKGSCYLKMGLGMLTIILIFTRLCW
jgi:hypothetical protein